MLVLALAALPLAALGARATTYFVRADGGTNVQCNGTADAAYPGSGSAQACAFNNLNWALPPGYTNDGAKPPVVKTGDTIQIGSGTYQMGYGSPGATACETNYTYACYFMQAIPDNLTIAGNCSAPPVLWGSGSMYVMLDFENARNLTVKCLELTDHSRCIDNYRPTTNTGGVTACTGSSPSAKTGLYFKSIQNLTLANLNIHGLGTYGIQAGKLSGNTNVSDVTLRANGWGGWNGDLGGNTAQWSNTGNLTFTNLKVDWNGCAEAYPATTIVGCWGQNEGGYGDGFAGSETGGNWTFKNSRFNHNTQDGLDLLYADGTGSIVVDHSMAWQNAGNGIKTSGTATLSNSVVNGYCNNWAGFPIAGSNATGVSGTMCRADGTAVVMEFVKPTGETITLSHNTITGNGDTLFVGGSEYGPPPTRSDVTVFRNNILLGQPSVIPRNGGAFAALDYYATKDGSDYAGTVQYQNNIIWHVKGGFCPAGNVCKDPLLKNMTLQNFDPTPLPGSPARNAAIPVRDHKGVSGVGTRRNIGAIQGKALEGA